MKPAPVSVAFALLLAPLAHLDAAVLDLSKADSPGALEAIAATVSDPALKKALSENAAAIVVAAKEHPHVEAVIRAIDSAPGTYTKTNTTPESLRKATGGDLAVFDTLTAANTSIANGKAHVYRNADQDPYDAAFMEHLGHISAIESVKIVATKIEDSWIPPLLKLKNLKSLSMEGTARGLPGSPALGDPSLDKLRALDQLPDLTSLELAYFGKATDTGLEQLAGLKNLEHFTFRGSPVNGRGFAKFDGWNKLKRINFHSNSLDDEGLGHVCEKFPNLEFIKLWHSKLITDASADHLKKLKRLTGIEISCSKATAALVKGLRESPLEYMALEYGVASPAPEAIALIESIPTLRRVSIDAKDFTDADLAALAGAKHLKALSLSGVDLSDARLQQLRAFAHLESLTLVRYGKGYPEETVARVLDLLPKTEVKVVK